jgi:hypothetical protein
LSARGAAAAAAIGAVALAARALLWEPARLRVREVELAPPAWPASLDGIRVAAVSDLHAGAPWMRERGVERVARAVRDSAPDLVALLGDFVDPGVAGARELAPFGVAERLAGLRAPLGTFAVLGNHDWGHTGPRMRRALADAGVPVLENEAVRVREDLWVVGLADASTRVPDPATAFAGVPDGPAVLCLVHDPDVFPAVPARAALTLAGHTHGGQVNLPVLRKLAVTSRHGDRYLAGHVVEGGRHLYVSRGIGTSRLPIRLRSPSELLVLRLRART